MTQGDGRGGRLGAGLDAAVENRLPFVAVAVILVFGVFFVRLFQLQILEGDDLRRRSERNSVRTVRLEAPRGDVLDRHGRVLATTRPAFGVQVIPNDLRRPAVTFDALGDLLDADPEALRSDVGEPRGRERFAPVRLAGDLSYDQVARIESHLYALSGVVTDVRPRRHYIGDEVAAHLLGSIGEIQKRQLETRDFADYRSGEVIGQAGVERLLESELRGRAGGRNLIVNVSGRVVDVLDEIEPEPGSTATLTIDIDLQKAGVEGFMPEVLGEPGKMGGLVALDPRNGDILALVSAPAYNPNDFAGGIDSATWKILNEDSQRPMQNRALAGQYPPGSTYKAIVAAAGLQEGLVDPHKTVYCPGSFRLGRRTYRCWKRAGHGPMDLRDALVQSCDVYFYQLGLELGVDRLAYFARAFNLGRRTGIRSGIESSGLVPTSVWKERRFREPWQKGETVSTSIGQGFNLATPLQMAVAFAAVANGGKLMRPRLVLRTQGRDGFVEPGPTPEVTDRVPVDPEHLARVRDALQGVVEDRHGTGGRSRVPGVTVAGKTGTAQVVRTEHTEAYEEDEIPLQYRDHAWFVAFAPVDDPEIVVSVVVEHGGHGGSAAAPIAQKVLAAYFEKRGIGVELLEAEVPAAAAALAAPPAETAPGALEVSLAGD
jgi:penicillin-binding protein 2